jgi:hypothetical protein
LTAYIDTSALLRLVLREPGALEDLQSCDALVSSELIAIESARTIDRLRLQGALTVDEAAARRRSVSDWLEAIDLVLLRPAVLSRASEPLPIPLGATGVMLHHEPSAASATRRNAARNGKLDRDVRAGSKDRTTLGPAECGAARAAADAAWSGRRLARRSGAGRRSSDSTGTSLRDVERWASRSD